MPYFVIFDGLLSYDHSANAQEFWQGQKDLNPRHAVLETAALPTELYPYICEAPKNGASWWATRDSNPGPFGYEPSALTN